MRESCIIGLSLLGWIRRPMGRTRCGAPRQQCARVEHQQVGAWSVAPVEDTGIGVRATIALLHQLGTTQPCATVGIQFIEPPDTRPVDRWCGREGPRGFFLSRLGLRMTPDPILNVLAQAKKLAQKYRALTGKPLGITGEVAEYEAARLLGVTLTPARQAGYDAVARKGNRLRRLQIKGRCILPGAKPGQRLGSIDITKPFDAVLLVVLDENFNAIEIHEASRKTVVAKIARPGSKARNERGALSVRKFKSIGRQVWPV